MARHPWAAAVVFAGLVLLAGCSGATAPPAAPSSSPPPSGAVDATGAGATGAPGAGAKGAPGAGATSAPGAGATGVPGAGAPGAPGAGATGAAGAGAPGAGLPELPAPQPGVCTVPTNGEMRGTGTLWALFFPSGEDPLPVSAGKEAKIVWKMGGTGDITFTATGPNGATTSPTWGPEGHGGSNWQRPGREVGTGWVFPAPGCWTVTATRTTGETGELWLAID